MDVGRPPIAYYFGAGPKAVQLAKRLVNQNDIELAVDTIGGFGKDNRAGIAGSLHRISAIRNRKDDIIGLTFRIGRALAGNLKLVNELVNTESSVLMLGSPGVGKTSAIRELSRKLSCEEGKRVVIIDTSNEIGGEGDIPHPAVGNARRMHVPHPSKQHEVMIEAVQNHMPQVLIIDEISTVREVEACRSIAERGVRLIATAHGRTLSNLLRNPELHDLVGGVASVVLSDLSAQVRGGSKCIQERKGSPTFPLLVEMRGRDRWLAHHTATSIDALLAGRSVMVQAYTGGLNHQEIETRHVEYSESDSVFDQDALYSGSITGENLKVWGMTGSGSKDPFGLLGGVAIESDLVPELGMDVFSLTTGTELFYPYSASTKQEVQKSKKKSKKNRNR